MGIEDYEFLTRTMERISLASTVLVNERESLSELKNEIIKTNQKITKTEAEIQITEGKIKRSPSQNEDKELTTSALNKKIKALDDEQDRIRNWAERSSMVPFWKRIGTQTNKPDDEILVIYPCILFLILIWLVSTATGVGAFECDNGKHLMWTSVADGNNDCGDGSDESLEGKELEDAEFWSDFRVITHFLFVIGYPVIASVVDGRKPGKAAAAISLIDKEKAGLKKQRSEIGNVSSLSLKVKQLQQYVAGWNEWLPKMIAALSDREKEAKIVEEGISDLWESIAHLIPFSTALEKA